MILETASRASHRARRLLKKEARREVVSEAERKAAKAEGVAREAAKAEYRVEFGNPLPKTPQTIHRVKAQRVREKAPRVRVRRAPTQSYKRPRKMNNWTQAATFTSWTEAGNDTSKKPGKLPSNSHRSTLRSCTFVTVVDWAKRAPSTAIKKQSSNSFRTSLAC